MYLVRYGWTLLVLLTLVLVHEHPIVLATFADKNILSPLKNQVGTELTKPRGGFLNSHVNLVHRYLAPAALWSEPAPPAFLATSFSYHRTFSRPLTWRRQI